MVKSEAGAAAKPGAGKAGAGAGVRSMTGFAAGRGSLGKQDWVWDLRAVNGRGLDLRLRVPDWIDGLEPALRAELQGRITRGSVSLSLKIGTARGAAGLDSQSIEAALSALAEVETRAAERGVHLQPSTGAELLNLRLAEPAPDEQDSGALLAALMAEVPALIDAFDRMRRSEGEALRSILSSQLAEIERLVEAARGELEARRDQAAANLREAVARLLGSSDKIDEARLTQELALMAVKSDIAEEIDRLTAHVAAARALLAEGGAIGRRLDFLTQEFNREANTLCSKAQFERLTRIGLDLKAVIDQMREQGQNVE